MREKLKESKSLSNKKRKKKRKRKKPLHSRILFQRLKSSTQIEAHINNQKSKNTKNLNNLRTTFNQLKIFKIIRTTQTFRYMETKSKCLSMDPLQRVLNVGDVGSSSPVTKLQMTFFAIYEWINLAGANLSHLPLSFRQRLFDISTDFNIIQALIIGGGDVRDSSSVIKSQMKLSAIISRGNSSGKFSNFHYFNLLCMCLIGSVTALIFHEYRLSNYMSMNYSIGILSVSSYVRSLLFISWLHYQAAGICQSLVGLINFDMILYFLGSFNGRSICLFSLVFQFYFLTRSLFLFEINNCYKLFLGSSYKDYDNIVFHNNSITNRTMNDLLDYCTPLCSLICTGIMVSNTYHCYIMKLMILLRWWIIWSFWTNWLQLCSFVPSNCTLRIIFLICSSLGSNPVLIADYYTDLKGLLLCSWIELILWSFSLLLCSMIIHLQLETQVYNTCYEQNPSDSLMEFSLALQWLLAIIFCKLSTLSDSLKGNFVVLHVQFAQYNWRYIQLYRLMPFRLRCTAPAIVQNLLVSLLRIIINYTIYRMKIFSWNIQGGLRPQALVELLYWKNNIDPDIMFVLETRTSFSSFLLFWGSMIYNSGLEMFAIPSDSCLRFCIIPLSYKENKRTEFYYYAFCPNDLIAYISHVFRINIASRSRLFIVRWAVKYQSPSFNSNCKVISFYMGLWRPLPSLVLQFLLQTSIERYYNERFIISMLATGNPTMKYLLHKQTLNYPWLPFLNQKSWMSRVIVRFAANYTMVNTPNTIMRVNCFLAYCYPRPHVSYSFSMGVDTNGTYSDYKSLYSDLFIYIMPCYALLLVLLYYFIIKQTMVAYSAKVTRDFILLKAVKGTFLSIQVKRFSLVVNQLVGINRLAYLQKIVQICTCWSSWCTNKTLFFRSFKCCVEGIATDCSGLIDQEVGPCWLTRRVRTPDWSFFNDVKKVIDTSHQRINTGTLIPFYLINAKTIAYVYSMDDCTIIYLCKNPTQMLDICYEQPYKGSIVLKFSRRYYPKVCIWTFVTKCIYPKVTNNGINKVWNSLEIHMTWLPIMSHESFLPYKFYYENP